MLTLAMLLGLIGDEACDRGRGGNIGFKGLEGRDETADDDGRVLRRLVYMVSSSIDPSSAIFESAC